MNSFSYDMKVTDKVKTLDCLNFIRLLAAIEVLYGHSVVHLSINSIPSYISNFIHIFQGVPIFFALSGYLIWMSIENKKNWKEFAIKRLNRIYPALWFAVALEITCILALYGYGNIRDFCLFIFGQSTLFQFWTPECLRGYGCGTPNGSLWTICVIVQFYLISWILYKNLHGTGKVHMGGTLFFSVLCSILIQTLLSKIGLSIVIKLYAQTIIRYLWLFFIGCIVAEFKDDVLPILQKYWFIFLFGVFIIDYGKIDIKAGYNVFRSIFLFCGVVGFAYKFPELNTSHDLSYEIYVNHMTVVNVLISYGVIKNIWSLVIVLFISFVIAIISKIFLNKINIGNYILRDN